MSDKQVQAGDLFIDSDNDMFMVIKDDESQKLRTLWLSRHNYNGVLLSIDFDPQNTSQGYARKYCGNLLEVFNDIREEIQKI